MAEPLNREQARWFGRASRKYVDFFSGEVITARLHQTAAADGIVIWRDAQSVGKSAGVVHWWEDSPNTTPKELEEKYRDWVAAGRPTDT